MGFDGRTNAPRLDKAEKFTNKDNMVSTCTDCLRGLFTDHFYTWTSRGLVHVDCENPRK